MSLPPLLAAIALFSTRAQETSTGLTPTAPGGVFMTGEQIVFPCSGLTSAVLSYSVVDYDGAEVCRGETAEGRVVLPVLGPGYYELHWRARGTEGVKPFGVVPARPDEPPPDGPLVVDGATAWLCAPEQWEPVAQMLRRIGVGWMRERLSWGQVNPQPGKLDWDKYETVAEVLRRHGVREYQIFHDSPGWTHPGKETRCPDDLREVYRFAKEAGAHFSGRILAWEPWNEPDISFFDQLGDKYAAVQKAAYLGFKAGNPKVLVLSCSFCRGRSPFSDNVFECGIGEYMDIFNFHTYAPIAQYENNLASWVGLTRTYRVARRPIWLTEAGIRLVAKDGKTLTPDQERTQAEFVPRSFATSLASGVDKHFFFVLPYYPENGVQFGALHEDLSPRPALLAIATAVRVLGKGSYLGRLPLEGASGRAHFFDNGSDVVAVLWADEPMDVKLPAATITAKVVDLVGREREVVAQKGTVPLQIGPSAQYVVGLGNVTAHLVKKVRSPGKLPSLNPSKTVIVGYADSTVLDKDSNCYRVGGQQPLSFIVDVYNFDERRPVEGLVRVVPPAGWDAERTEHRVRLEPMGRETLRLALQPGFGRGAGTLAKIRAEGEFPGQKVMPSVSYLRVDLASLAPTKRLSLNLDRTEVWQTNIPSYGKMQIVPGPEGGVAFPITFTGPGDRWCYPRVSFPQVQDWRRYQAIAFEYRFDTEEDSTTARVQVIEATGASYLCTPQPASRKWRRVVASFSELSWGSFSKPDPNRKLDLDQVAALLIGCNTARVERLTLEVRNVELLAFD